MGEAPEVLVALDPLLLGKAGLLGWHRRHYTSERKYTAPVTKEAAEMARKARSRLSLDGAQEVDERAQSRGVASGKEARPGRSGGRARPADSLSASREAGRTD
jgi:hypothetical protein